MAAVVVVTIASTQPVPALCIVGYSRRGTLVRCILEIQYDIGYFWHTGDFAFVCILHTTFGPNRYVLLV